MKKINQGIEETTYLGKRNSRRRRKICHRRNLSPEQRQRHRKEIGVIAETKQKGKIRMKERKSFLNPKTQGNWKAAGNPRGMPLIPPISRCHVATPPSLIKFEAEPQASQTTQRTKLFTFYGPHDTSLTTIEPGGNWWDRREHVVVTRTQQWRGYPLMTNKPSSTRKWRPFNGASK